MAENEFKNLLIVTTVSSWPEALVAQSALLKNYCKDSFDFACVVDTREHPSQKNNWELGARDRTIEIAHSYCDKVLIFPEELHQDRRKIFPGTMEKGDNAALRCADVTQYAWEFFRENYSSIVILDSDMFPISDFSISGLLGGKSVAGVLQKRETQTSEVTHFWNGLLAAHFMEKPGLSEFSFDAGMHNGVRTDVGGGTWRWIRGNAEGFRAIDHLVSLQWSKQDIPENINNELKNYLFSDTRNKGDKFYSEIYDEKFLHLRGGSNWVNEPWTSVQKRQSDFLKSLNTLVPFHDFEIQISKFPKKHKRNASRILWTLFGQIKWLFRKLI